MPDQFGLSLPKWRCRRGIPERDRRARYPTASWTFGVFAQGVDDTRADSTRR